MLKFLPRSKFATPLSVIVLSLVALVAAPGNALATLDSNGPGAKGTAGSVGNPNAVDEISPPNSSDMVLRIQRALAELGLYRGPQDGRMTPDTKAGVRRYQKSASLTVNGRVSGGLVQDLEYNLKLHRLRKKLDQARIRNMSAARHALLSHPATRNLVIGAPDEATDPTLDPEACLKNVTVRCLLHEALKSANAVYKPERHDWAMREIVVAMARAGLGEEAKDTAGRIRDPRLIMVALRDISAAQAVSGLIIEALAAAEIIPDPRRKAEALVAIADNQIRRGDLAAARETVERLLRSLDDLSDTLRGVSVQTRAAVILARAGDGPRATSLLADVEADARARTDAGGRNIALHYVAVALAQMERPEQALDVLSDITGDSNRTPVLISTAAAQARAGNMAAAWITVDSIDSARYRAVILSRIALAEAERGKPETALELLRGALPAIKKIKLPFARSFAISRISLSMADIGKLPGAAAWTTALFRHGAETATLIGDNKLRAQTLWTIATEQARAGDHASASTTEAQAEDATGKIRSTLSRIWMFSEIAANHAAIGERDLAWMAFDRGLRAAHAIANSWGRARAFGRLAVTLIELVDSDLNQAPGETPTRL